MTRAKFECVEVIEGGEGTQVKLTPVVGGSEENEKFFKYTPFGKIELGILNPDVVFVEGKQYYVDFTESV